MPPAQRLCGGRDAQQHPLERERGLWNQEQQGHGEKPGKYGEQRRNERHGRGAAAEHVPGQRPVRRVQQLPDRKGSGPQLSGYPEVQPGLRTGRPGGQKFLRLRRSGGPDHERERLSLHGGRRLSGKGPGLPVVPGQHYCVSVHHEPDSLPRRDVFRVQRQGQKRRGGRGGHLPHQRLSDGPDGPESGEGLLLGGQQQPVAELLQ